MTDDTLRAALSNDNPARLSVHQRDKGWLTEDEAYDAIRAALAASAPEGPLPGQEVGHGCSPECNACRADRLAASATDEGPTE